MRATSIVYVLSVCVGAIGAVTAGCILVTGGTDGYSALDAGPTTQCLTAADCKGGAAGDVCCLVLSGSPGFYCQRTCEPIPSAVQVCSTTAECQGQESCIAQECEVGDASFPLTACGLQPALGCSAIGNGGTPDAGTPDASTPDGSGPGDAGHTPDSSSPIDAGPLDATTPDASDASDAGILDAQLDSAG
jgi:hypothetical protein